MPSTGPGGRIGFASGSGSGLYGHFHGTGEEGDDFGKGEDSWLAKAGLPFRKLRSGSEVPLALGDLLVVLSGFFAREPGWLGDFTFDWRAVYRIALIQCMQSGYCYQMD